MTGASHHSPSLRRSFVEAAFVRTGRRFVDDARELHRQRRAADAEARAPRRDRARHRRERDLENADEIDAERIERAAEVAVLVIGEATPVLLGHFAHGDRLVVGVGDVVAEGDGAVGIIDVAQAIEARIEGADEVASGIVDRCRQPALGVIAKPVVHRKLADVASDRGCDINKKQREEEVEHSRGGDVTQRPELGIESDRSHQPAHDAPRHPQAELAEGGQMPQDV